MEHKNIIIILVIAIIITVVLLSLRFTLVNSPATCQTIVKNEGSNKIDIVFLTKGVGEDKVEEFASYLTSMEPFSSNEEKFNFFYAGSTEDCKLVQDNVLLCYSSSLLRQAASCPDDYVVVLTKEAGSIRSSAYTNVISLNINLPKSVLRHEFGHVFGNLADEYVPSDIPRGSKNCQKICDFEIKDGCFEGCSKSNYYRSSQNSIMKTLSISDYQTLNNQLMLEKLGKYD